MAPACSGGGEVAKPLAERVAEVVNGQLGVDHNFDQVRALVVTRNGETLYETYPDSSPEDYHVVFSITKSLVSTLVGMAIDDGLIDGVHATVGDLLPAYDDRMSRTVSTTTVEQLLTMSSGLTSPEDSDSIDFMRSRDPVAHALTHPDGPPGAEFVYSNEASHVLAAILEETTGRRLLEYAREELFQPVGIPTEPAAEPPASLRDRVVQEYLRVNTFGWPVDAQRVHLGFSFVKLRAADMTRIGQLYLAQGAWGGHQIVSAGWVDDATTAHVPTGTVPEEYGYQWWVGQTQGHPTYSARGFGGQLIQVVPDLDLVITVATEVDPTSAADFGVSHELLAYVVDLVVEQVDA